MFNFLYLIPIGKDIMNHMRKKVILICSECLSRNYTTTKKSENSTERLEIKKYCPQCNKHTIHKESR